GQEHLTGSGSVLRNSIENGKIPSMILWGPPGVGKTTIANIIAKTLDFPFYTLSAISSGVKEVREVIEESKKIDNAILFIVGNSPPPEIRGLGTNNDNIVVTGYVASLYPFYQSAKVVVCPLRIGGGIKVKILEALRIGKAIVSTSVGAQGLNLDSSAIRISDKISEFANYVVRFLANPRERRLQEQNALQYAKSFPMWNQVIGEYVRCYAEVSSNS
ncbi:MAG: glycosyltransferase, partial [Nitrososphaeraceae archaeon]